jgi:predicted ATP-binding protein involved in virulence
MRMNPMLTKLEINNFRCFASHTIEFQPKSLIVGKNNAGKSTCIEALRFISLVTERMMNLGIREEIRQREKCGANKSNPQARKLLDERWQKLGASSVVSGKELLSYVARWSQDKYGVSLSIRSVLRAMNAQEVPQEMSDFIKLVTHPSGTG